MRVSDSIPNPEFFLAFTPRSSNSLFRIFYRQSLQKHYTDGFVHVSVEVRIWFGAQFCCNSEKQLPFFFSLICGYVRTQYQLAICLYQGRGADRNMKEAVMASNKASSDDNSGRMKRRKLREMFPANKGETNESIHVSTGFHISVFEGMSLLKSDVAAIKSDVGRLRSTLGCLEPNIETLRQKLIEVQDLACELKVGGIEGIVGEVIHVVTTMWPNTMHKVAENVIQPMEENGEHNLVADIRKESRKRKFWLSHPIWNFSLSPPLSLDSRAKHRICEEIPANEVDRMEDKRVRRKGKEKNGMVEEAKHRKRNKKFPLMGKISPKDSKVLKFLFRKPRREHKSRKNSCFGPMH